MERAQGQTSSPALCHLDQHSPGGRWKEEFTIPKGNAKQESKATAKSFNLSIRSLEACDGLSVAIKVKLWRTLIYWTLQKTREISFSLKFNFTLYSASVILSGLECNSPVGGIRLDFDSTPSSHVISTSGPNHLPALRASERRGSAFSPSPSPVTDPLTLTYGQQSEGTEKYPTEAG